MSGWVSNLTASPTSVRGEGLCLSPYLESASALPLFKLDLFTGKAVGYDRAVLKLYLLL